MVGKEEPSTSQTQEGRN